MALSATFLADFSSFLTATSDATTALQELKGEAGELGPQLDEGLQMTTAQAEALGRSIRGVALDVVASSKTFIAAYTEEQDAVGRLNTALEATGQATPAVVAAYQDLATQFQNTTKYADEAIIDVQATLTTIGQVGPEQMGLALEAVTNLASGMKIDLSTAADMVAKAFASGGENLGKLKKLLGDAYQPGMDAADMLNAINEKFGPAAQNELNTYNGKIEQLNNQTGEFNEKVGKQLVDMLSQVMGAFQALPQPVQDLVLAVVAIGTAVAPVLVSLSSLISILATPAIGAAMSSALTGLIALMTGPVGIAIAAAAVLAAIVYNWDRIVEVTRQMYEAVKGWLVDRFTAIVDGIKAKLQAVVDAYNWMKRIVVSGSIVPDMIDEIGGQFDRLDAEMVKPAQAATVEVTDAYNKMLAYTAQANAILSENSLFTTTGQRERVAALAERMFAPQGGGGGGAVTVNNTFNIQGGTEDLARRVSDEIMRTIRAGTQLSTA